MSVYKPFLVSLGWNDFFQTSLDSIPADGVHPARITSQGRGHYHIQIAPDQVLEAVISTALHDTSKKSGDFPTVGDWITFSKEHGQEKATIHRVLERSSLLQRKRAGTAEKNQHLAANVDHMLIVTSLNDDFNLERLGRYFEISKGSGAVPCFILTKADLCPDPNAYTEQLQQKFANTEIILVSSKNENTMDSLKKFFMPTKTAVMLGSSGVGKSTLTNYLRGHDLQRTGELSMGTRGKHTTTARSLLFTRWGGLVIDTPGMQEIFAIDLEDESQSCFADIEELILQCKFTNCRHQSDPGCAVTTAQKNGTLNATRWADYQKGLSKVTPPKKKWQK